MGQPDIQQSSAAIDSTPAVHSRSSGLLLHCCWAMEINSAQARACMPQVFWEDLSYWLGNPFIETPIDQAWSSIAQVPPPAGWQTLGCGWGGRGGVGPQRILPELTLLLVWDAVSILHLLWHAGPPSQVHLLSTVVDRKSVERSPGNYTRRRRAIELWAAC